MKRFLLMIFAIPGLLCAENLITNPGFEDGFADFTTEYTVNAAGRVDLGEVDISTNPAAVHNLWIDTEDHSGTNGLMLIANGAQDTSTIVWSQTVDVETNKLYVFSAWSINVVDASLIGTTEPGTFCFYVNDQQLQPEIDLPAAAGSPDFPPWQNYSAIWTNATGTNATLAIRMTSDYYSGNDFAIDDLSFHRYCNEIASTSTISKAVAVCWKSKRDQMYQPQWTYSLASNTWFSLDKPIRGTGRQMECWDTVPHGSVNRYYRVIPIE